MENHAGGSLRCTLALIIITMLILMIITILDQYNTFQTHLSLSVGRLVGYNNPAVSWPLCQVHSFALWCGFYMCKDNKAHALGHKDTLRGTQCDITPFACLCGAGLYFTWMSPVLQLFFKLLKLRKCWLCLVSIFPCVLVWQGVRTSGKNAEQLKIAAGCCREISNYSEAFYLLFRCIY